ncbi:putative holin-like toxin [uncultured Granulicatella sp.]
MFSVYEALTLVCSFATLLVALVSLVVKLIDMKTKNGYSTNTVGESI